MLLSTFLNALASSSLSFLRLGTLHLCEVNSYPYDSSQRPHLRKQSYEENIFTTNEDGWIDLFSTFSTIWSILSTLATSGFWWFRQDLRFIGCSQANSESKSLLLMIDSPLKKFTPFNEFYHLSAYSSQMLKKHSTSLSLAIHTLSIDFILWTRTHIPLQPYYISRVSAHWTLLASRMTPFVWNVVMVLTCFLQTLYCCL